MDVKVLFVGEDKHFYSTVELRFEKFYDDCNFEYSQAKLEEKEDINNVYRLILSHGFDIVFIDFDENDVLAAKLSKLINSNAELRKISLCALHSHTHREVTIDTAIAQQVRINHIKGIELFNIVYDTMSFVDINKAKTPPFVMGEKLANFNLYYDVHISYMKGTYFHVETNIKLPENKIIELDAHPIEHMCSSKRFLVKNFSDSNLFYNKRFSYDLEFTYVDDHFMRNSEDIWLDYLKYKDKPSDYRKDKKQSFDEITPLIKKRQTTIKNAREEIKAWVENNKNEAIKKTKVLILDDALTFLDEVERLKDVTVKFETAIMSESYQIDRFKPHIIIVNQTEKNTAEAIHSFVNQIESEQKSPFVLVTNTQENFEYQRCLSFPADLDLDTLQKLITTFKEKVDISSDKQRYFFDKNALKTKAQGQFTAQVLKMNESEAYFRADYEVPDWTVLEVHEPFFMLFTIVPDVEGSEYGKDPSVYRALINGTTETVKSDLRVMINASLEEEEEEEEDLNQDEESDSDQES